MRHGGYGEVEIDEDVIEDGMFSSLLRVVGRAKEAMPY